MEAIQITDGGRLSIDEAGPANLSVADALRTAGEENADYVRVRTRSEIAWLRLVAEWFDDEAERLDRELTAAA